MAYNSQMFKKDIYTDCLVVALLIDQLAQHLSVNILLTAAAPISPKQSTLQLLFWLEN
jgi:hypothetical protein